MAVTSLAKAALQEYKCDANQVVKLKLVRKLEDIKDESKAFTPVMSHQVFGSSETVFGYKGLEIQLYYTASRLITFVGVKYDSVINSDEFDGVKPDDVLRAISKQVPPGFHTNLSEFMACFDKETTFRPFGNLLHSYSKNIEGNDRQFEIYKNTIEAPGFRSFHERLQTFLLWYVDAASYIDVDDDRWSFYVIYEKVRLDTGDFLYTVIGYQTVYSYYAYPELIRPRVSQVLIFPPFQRQGHGAELLQTFYRECWCSENILDITVEDPSEDYQRLRDFLDVKNSMGLDAFSPDNLNKGFTKELVNSARQRLKINKKQCRRVYEILKFKYTTPDKMRDYRLEVKRRLYQPFQQSRKEMARMRQVLNKSEFDASQLLTKEQKQQYLETTYQELTTEYRHILERLAIA